MKRIAILGSTGSVGASALDVVRHLSGECRVTGLAARSRWELLHAQIREFRPTRAALLDPEALGSLRAALNGNPIRLVAGAEEVATAPDVDLVLSAITGAAGLGPGLAALRNGKTLALANKESLVMAGPLMLETARLSGVEIVPVDSEHSAIFQAMRCGRAEEVRRVILTASGGPFRGRSKEQLQSVTPEQALRHPTWNMGNKITIDSATLFNKALEIVEARWLFDLRPDQIEVVIHPQSVIHSMVEFRDGSIMAQMGVPDMRTPIQYALTHPLRPAGNVRFLSFSEVKELTFESPDLEAFPSLALGRRAAETGGTMGAVLNAANEVAVELFLARRIPFPRIFEIVKAAMDRHTVLPRPALADLLEADAWARTQAREAACSKP